MKEIPRFRIDDWVREHSSQSKTDLHGSYVSALSLNDLQRLSPTGESPIDNDLKLTYGATAGSLALRSRVAELHSSDAVTLTADNVVITTGSILANYLVLATLCGPGDHVIVQYPTYGQLYILPRFNGAEVSLWGMEEDNGWLPNTTKLASLIKQNTKAIIINNPSNPTGTALPVSLLREVQDLASKHDLTVFSDEVFSPLFHGDEKPPPFVSLGYNRSVSTGSVSKAHGLPGVRLGWVVSPDLHLLQRIVTARDYTTISVSRIDDGVANFALSPQVLPRILEKNLSVCKSSIALLEGFVARNSDRVRWTKSTGGGTAFLKIVNPDGNPVEDAQLAVKLLQEESISVIPGGECFGDGAQGDFKGYIRVTLGEETRLRKAIPMLEAFLKRNTVI